jgi:hypothetical protein
LFPIYADEDSGIAALAEAATAIGIDWLRAADAGMSGAADGEQLAFATARGRAIVTANRRDFMRLHTEWMEAGRHHAGILVIADQRTSIGTILRKLGELEADRTVEMMRDAILFISGMLFDA